MNIEDRFEVTDLVTRSVYALDVNDMKDFSDCHVNDHILELKNADFPTIIIEGREKYVKRLTKSEERLASGLITKHHISNMLIKEVSDDLLWGRTLGIVTMQREPYSKPDFSHTSTVEYEFRKTSYGWRISKTNLVIDHIRE